PSLELKVLDSPQQGTTYFTDASSQTQRAVVVWKVEGQWQKQTWTEQGKSVQWLEAKAVQMTLQKDSDKHINICMDSMYVYKLVLSMKRGGHCNSAIATMLLDALQQRAGTSSIIHLRSHQTGPGPLIEGNEKADQAAAGIWTVQDAKTLHEQLHLGAKALAKECKIPISEARRIVATCPYCQH
ncbi:POL1 protein, partial [Lophotis ruficrista]|nr:POL1 protein [Lophotis ruficrista]